ncbi:MAG: hypothetical protein M3298_02690 [Thermoproteota archaeon]|nr:hypothetical protein [Thermoproteota archaeon]MDQ3807056.1 hypothetical protein [Thermoproteota archaeon]
MSSKTSLTLNFAKEEIMKGLQVLQIMYIVTLGSGGVTKDKAVPISSCK